MGDYCVNVVTWNLANGFCALICPVEPAKDASDSVVISQKHNVKKINDTFTSYDSAIVDAGFKVQCPLLTPVD